MKMWYETARRARGLYEMGQGINDAYQQHRTWMIENWPCQEKMIVVPDKDGDILVELQQRIKYADFKEAEIRRRLGDIAFLNLVSINPDKFRAAIEQGIITEQALHGLFKKTDTSSLIIRRR
ncbi:MAG: hypothetical protein GX033_00595 [Firmicutes bacterium]|nr:hypothetical protein [Bacillota bacterium]